MRDIAISKDYQKKGLTRRIIRNLQGESYRRGITGNQIFTKPANVPVFEHMGFKCVAVAEPYAALLEHGTDTLEDYLGRVRAILGSGEGKNRGAIVMNCNPFTLGHRSLVEYAHNNCDEVIIFAVREDRSVFPFSDRFSLLKQGVRDMKGVEVISGGDYIISNATFPTYFIKGTDELAAQTKLDATVFATRIAPALNISVRFVGEEPTDKTTLAYNKAMKEVFNESGIELKEIPREQKGNQIVSASTVRKALAEDDWETVYRMVPKTTLVYLKSDAGQEVIRRIKMMDKIDLLCKRPDGFLPSRIGHADLMTGLHELLRQSPADMPDTNDTYIHIHASYILKVLYILYTRGKREGTGETNYSSE